MLPRIATLAVLVSLVAAAPLAAQFSDNDVYRPTDFTVGGGIAIPLKTFRALSKTGLVGQVGVEFMLSRQIPLAVRVNAAYEQLNGKPPLGLEHHDRRLIGGVAELLLHVPLDPNTPWDPYVFAGGGFYHQSLTDLSGNPSGTHIAFQGGLGFAGGIGAIRPFLEVQVQSVFLNGSNVKTVPIVVGVRIGRRKK
jgi:hypothetical protein